MKKLIIIENVGQDIDARRKINEIIESVEQSKEEQCHDFCHLNGQPVHCQSCKPKTEDFYEDAFTEEDLKTERIRNAKMNDHLDSIRKTEDTGECKCYRINENTMQVSPICPLHRAMVRQGVKDPVPEPEIKAFGVFKEVAKEDSCDTIPAPLNKDWSDRAIKLENWEMRLELWQSGYPTMEGLRKIISQEIESARASERARIIEIIQKHKYQKDIKSKLKSQNPLKEILRNKSQQTRIQVVNDILDELLSKIEK